MHRRQEAIYFEVQWIAKDTFKGAKVSWTFNGLLLDRVHDGEAADRHGMVDGDLVIAINGMVLRGVPRPVVLSLLEKSRPLVIWFERDANVILWKLRKMSDAVERVQKHVDLSLPRQLALPTPVLEEPSTIIEEEESEEEEEEEFVDFAASDEDVTELVTEAHTETGVAQDSAGPGAWWTLPSTRTNYAALEVGHVSPGPWWALPSARTNYVHLATRAAPAAAAPRWWALPSGRTNYVHLGAGPKIPKAKKKAAAAPTTAPVEVEEDAQLAELPLSPGTPDLPENRRGRLPPGWYSAFTQDADGQEEYFYNDPSDGTPQVSCWLESEAWTYYYQQTMPEAAVRVINEGRNPQSGALRRPKGQRGIEPVWI